ncbi:MAG TPA: SLC13 family permease, partial [Planctomycetota bacterium]|nr:SLC13 family permease [Planctomycetota bacterium]
MTSGSGKHELEAVIARESLPYHFEKRKLFYTVLGLAAFLVINYMPSFSAAIDPSGKVIELSREGQGAIGLFLLAMIWWVLEVVPIGITSVAIGVFQALFLIRPSGEAFRDFMDPSVLFIFGSLMLGLAFSKTGLTRRLAYHMLSVVGERTDRILLGSFVITALLSHLMAHTAAAATVYPVMLTVLALYGDGDRPTRFGKALFIGMAASAGAGSVVTILG